MKRLLFPLLKGVSQFNTL